MEPVNNDGMCRCCASEGTFKDLQSTYLWMGIGEVYSDMIKDCFDISLSTSISGNGGICEVCITQLRNACNFKKQVEQTEEQFRRRLADSEFRADVVKIEVPPDVEGHDADNDPFEGTVSGEFSRPANVLKIEVPPDDEDHDADNDPFEGTMSDEFSGPEYDIPLKNIKIEKEIEKPKKRAAKPSTSKAKKPKAEDGEPSVKRKRTIKIERRNTEQRVELNFMKCGGKAGRLTETKKNLQNLVTILLNSNANPIRCKDSLGYGCAFCIESYQDAKDLKKHYLNEHNSDRLIKLMSEKLIEHVVKLDITYLNCALCDKDIPTLDNLMEHLKNEHAKNIYNDIRSPIVPFKFDSPELRCAVCTTAYSSFKILQEHMSSHFGNHICNVCGKSYMTPRLLLLHLNRHKTDKVKCKQCDKTFSNEENLRGHEKRTHLGLSKRNKCLMCDERFMDYWKKVDHMVKVHGAPPVVLKCQACDRTFNNQRALANHTKKDHLLERKHKCDECDMKFFSKSNLQRHMTKHTGSRQYRCDVCFKSYGRKHTLREHMRIHEDDRRFACTQCGQAFVQKCSWRSHMRSKHGEEV